MTLSELCSIWLTSTPNGAERTLASTRAPAGADPRCTLASGTPTSAASSRPAARSGSVLRIVSVGASLPPSVITAVIGAA